MKFQFMFFAFLFFFISCSPNSGNNENQEEKESPERIEDSSRNVNTNSNSVRENKFGIKIGELERSLIDAGLVNVSQAIPEIKIDLKYSTTENFFGKDVYGSLENCYLQAEVVVMLKHALNTLQENHPNLTFLVFDGVRPLSVQQHLWDHIEKPDSLKPLYVADPKTGSLHNYGLAVDLTLFDFKSGKALDMGTPYDYFGYLAYPDQETEMLKSGKLSQLQVKNREILRQTMQSAGFSIIGSEWWHFNAYSLEEAQEKFEMIK